jgi:hypothetical protein
VIEYGHKSLGLYASWKKNEIAVIEIDENQWGDPRVILKVQATITQCFSRTTTSSTTAFCFTK